MVDNENLLSNPSPPPPPREKLKKAKTRGRGNKLVQEKVKYFGPETEPVLVHVPELILCHLDSFSLKKTKNVNCFLKKINYQ